MHPTTIRVIGARTAVRSLSESLVNQTMTTVEARLDAFFNDARHVLRVAGEQASVGAFDLAARGDGFDDESFRAERQHRNRLLVPIIESSPQISSVMIAGGSGREHMLLRMPDQWRNRCSAADEADEVSWLEWSGEAPSGWNLPADETGGDFYDWLALPDGRVVLTLADVNGHGIGPALIVAVYRAYVRASTTVGNPQVGEALGRINDLLFADIPDNRFITAVIGVLDPKTRRMDMVSAGHGPLLYFEAATNTVQSWNADAVPLGIMQGVHFGPKRDVRFALGDMLMFVTDGFFEWPNRRGEMYGLRRLEDFVRGHQSLSPTNLIHALHSDVVEHADGTEQGDDLTAVVIRCG